MASPQPRPNPREGQSKKAKKPKFTAKEKQLLRESGYSNAQIAQLETYLKNDQQKQMVIEQAKQEALQKEAELFGLDQKTAQEDVIIRRAAVPSRWDNAGWGAGNVTKPVHAAFLDVVKDPYDWGNAKVEDLQTKLVAAGFLEEGTYRPGIYDAATINAYQGATIEALRQKKTPREILSEYAGARPEEPKRPAVQQTFTPSPFRPMGEEDLEQSIDSAAREVLGEQASERDLSRIKAIFRLAEQKRHGQQVSAERAGFEAQVSDLEFSQQQAENPTGAGVVTREAAIPSVPDISSPQSIAVDQFNRTEAGQNWSVARGVQALIRALGNI